MLDTSDFPLSRRTFAGVAASGALAAMAPVAAASVAAPADAPSARPGDF